uniref:Uncharacterized protein n=1 Tax=Knipowitschia caucasica TaxID=637954 RepID=A0AAV2JN12_KNICA
MYQTVSKMGAITVQRSMVLGGSFFLVLVVKSEDGECGGSGNTSETNQSKILEVVVSPVTYDAVKVIMVPSVCLGLIICLCIPLCIRDTGKKSIKCCLCCRQVVYKIGMDSSGSHATEHDTPDLFHGPFLDRISYFERTEKIQRGKLEWVCSVCALKGKIAHLLLA